MKLLYPTDTISRRKVRFSVLCLVWILLPVLLFSQHSVARKWNEVLLEAIRNDLARPTVHARNLFHVSAAMYDAWAVYDEVADTYLLGKTVNGYSGCDFEGLPTPTDLQAAREEAISYAAFRMLESRFRNSPGFRTIDNLCDSLMLALGYDAFTSGTDYAGGDPAALGNYIAQCYLNYGWQDNSNEREAYANRFYAPVNAPLDLTLSGNPWMSDPNRWQPLAFRQFIDQGGNPLPGNVPDFLGPEWGRVKAFALQEEDLTVGFRGAGEYWVYHDPGAPPYLYPDDPEASADYKWNFELVSIWGSHLDPSDGVLWDVSPRGIGNIPELPGSMEEYPQFYDLFEGGDPSRGHDINPATGEPYASQWVPRGDYTRVLAEFWADGPDSETPPGHWFVILNHVNDHPQLIRTFKGEGPELSALEWDIKSYFLLGGTMHDAAVTAWGIKGYYDFVRPISAIRYMAGKGQSSDRDLPNYDPEGVKLYPGFVELVEAGDPLAGPNGQHIGKIKLFSWRGHAFINDPEVDQAGVGWILAEHWWPYQRPSFVTPPFAGYVSGHSTYSRSAAEVMTRLTGDPYFPGGMGEFPVKKNEFLVFEEGPSQDFTLQWATYRDASDQTSLSRIWGGIHPPADDIPGRKIGIEIAEDAFSLAERYFLGEAPEEPLPTPGLAPSLSVYPNPARSGNTLVLAFDRPVDGVTVQIFNIQGQLLREIPNDGESLHRNIYLPSQGLVSGVYVVRVSGAGWSESVKLVVH